MLITKTSVWSSITRTRDLPITQEQVEAWQGGMLIQNAMPNLTPAEREFLITGITQDEWEEMSRTA